MKKLLMVLPVIALAAGVFAPGAHAEDASDPSDCGGAWLTVTLGSSNPAVGGECEASLVDPLTVSGQAEALVGTTFGSSMSGSVALEIKDQDGNLIASCSDSKSTVAFGDWVNGDRPSCSTGAVDITGQGVTDITCDVTNGVRTGTYECALS